VFVKLGINASNLSIGGTGLLIVVTVGLETLRQVNSRALMVTYDDYGTDTGNKKKFSLPIFNYFWKKKLGLWKSQK
jgi:hypothetical protein